MKKILFFAATAAIALASCAKEETLGTVPQTNGGALSFSAYTTSSSSTASKAGEVNSNADFATKNGSFGVFGYKYGIDGIRTAIGLGESGTGAAVNNLEVSPVDGSAGYDWDYGSDLLYWLTEGTTQSFEFYAYSPFIERNEFGDIVNGYGATPTVNANGNGLSFKYKTDTHNQGGSSTFESTDDLMYAVSTDIAADKKGKVTLNFEHALSQVGVQLTVAEGFYVEVDSVYLTKFKDQGIFTVKAATGGTNSGSWADLEFVGSGGIGGSYPVGAILLNNEDLAKVAVLTKNVIDGSGNNKTNYILGPGTYNLTAPNAGYMAIPQYLVPSTGATIEKPGYIDQPVGATLDPKLQLNFKMWDQLPNTDEIYNNQMLTPESSTGVPTANNKVGRLVFPLSQIVTVGDGTNAAADWVQGYKYLYHITLYSADGSGPGPDVTSPTVIFRASVEKWNDNTTTSGVEF